MALKFNLSSIPKGAKITKAELGLFAYGIATGSTVSLKNGSKSLYKINAAWTESAIKWTGAPAASATALATSAVATTNVWEKFDVTSHVKAVVENDSANNGYLLRFPSTDFGVKFRSSEYATTADRPKLTVTYEATDQVAPKVNVTAPGTEETLKQGATYTVKWTATDNVGVVSCAIYFSSNNGTSWTKVDSAAGNTGTFKWTVPAVTSQNCLIKVMAYDGAGNVGTANSVKFAVEPAVAVLPHWNIPAAESYNVTVTTVQGRKIVSFDTKDVRLIGQKVAALPSGVHIVHIATQGRKLNRTMQFVK